MSSNLSFWLMSWEFRFRDWFRPPRRVLAETGLVPGMNVLDFGCGPGGFSLAAARLVGEEGTVYAVDINPLALASVRRAAGREGLKNIRPVFGSDLAAIPGESIDVVLLYDVLHELVAPDIVFTELHRLLKANGVLSIRDHHLPRERLLKIVLSGSLFRFYREARRHYQYRKQAPLQGKNL